MKSKRYFLFVIFLNFFSLVQGQDVTIYTGISQSSMQDLKLLQVYQAGQIHVPYEFTDEFPSYWQYGLTMRWKVSNKSKVGFNTYTTSTGARSIYSDYSGKTYQDYVVKCFGLATYYEFTLLEKKKVEVGAYSELGYNLSTLSYDEYFQLGNQVLTESENFKSGSLMGEIGGLCKYNLTEKFYLEGRIGFQLNQKSTLVNDDDNYIIIPYSNKVEADWTGFKFGLGIGLRL